MQLISFLFFIILSITQAAQLSTPCSGQSSYRLGIGQNESVEIKCIEHKNKPAYASFYYLEDKAIRKTAITKKSFKDYQQKFKKAFSELPAYRKNAFACTDLAVLTQDRKKKVFCGDEIKISLKKELFDLFSSISQNL